MTINNKLVKCIGKSTEVITQAHDPCIVLSCREARVEQHVHKFCDCCSPSPSMASKGITILRCLYDYQSWGSWNVAMLHLNEPYFMNTL